MASVRERLESLFADEGLPLPAVPDELAQRLEPIDRFLFATPGVRVRPYALGAFTAPLRAGQASDGYAVVGIDGHGTNSWAMHNYVVQGPGALFIQLPWGGAYGDRRADGAAIATAFRWARGMQRGLVQAQAEGKIPAGWRLLAILTEFGEPGWGWIAPPGERPMPWHADGNTMLESGRAVVDLVEGRTKLGV
jgi:hypothetical protein